MDGNNIGERIAGLRKEKGMTQAELAAVINISDKAISKWESAGSCPDIDVLIKLSDFFEVSLDYIIRSECMHQQKMFEFHHCIAFRGCNHPRFEHLILIKQRYCLLRDPNSSNCH